MQILGIKENPRGSWEECENLRFMSYLEDKLEMDTSNINIERAHRDGENRTIKKVIVVDFSFYKDEINISRD